MAKMEIFSVLMERRSFEPEGCRCIGKIAWQKETLRGVKTSLIGLVSHVALQLPVPRVVEKSSKQTFYMPSAAIS